MLSSAPKFYELAKRIVEITTDCIIVAHNAKFDYRILRTEFKRLGYDYERETLCTVELSKKLIPGYRSYSLGKLTKKLGIPIKGRHRASGDAIATVKLFKLLLDKDLEKTIIKASIREEPKRQLEPKLIDIIRDLPPVTGVYYLHKNNGDIIYIGKSKNIKKRINQHFTSDDRKSKKIQSLVSAVSYDDTGSELVALLKESEEIKRLKPIFNRALRRNKFSHGLYSFEDEHGYINFKIAKVDGKTSPITTFSSLQSAKKFISNITEKYELCQKLTGEYKTKSGCFNYSIKKCSGACLQEEPADIYNARKLKVIKTHSFQNKNMLIIDRGRDVDEHSIILVEKGIFKGIGYFNLNYQITNKEVLESLLTPMQHNKDAQHTSFRVS
jgi:DNA polymerase-3 subunit epsilon